MRRKYKFPSNNFLIFFVRVTAICSPECQNGGICSKPQQCTCLSTHTGSNCQTRTYLVPFSQTPFCIHLPYNTMVDTTHLPYHTMVASGGVLSEAYAHGGSGVRLGDGQTEAERVPSQCGRGDALLRRISSHLT